MRLLSKSLILFLIFFVLVGLLVSKTRLLVVNSLDIKNSSAWCVEKDKLEEQLKLKGKSIFDKLVLDKEQLLKKYPCIKDIRIEKKLPNKVVIKLIGRSALTRVASFHSTLPLDLNEASPSSQTALINWEFPPQTSKSYLIADEEGVVFDFTDSTNSAILYLPNQKLEVGSRLDREFFRRIALIFKKLEGFEAVNFQAKLLSNYLLVIGDQKIAFNLKNDLLRQVGSLQLISQKAKIDGRPIEVIDLRFDKPIVVYGKK